MKKLLVLILVGFLAVSLVACGGTDPMQDGNQNQGDGSSQGGNLSENDPYAELDGYHDGPAFWLSDGSGYYIYDNETNGLGEFVPIEDPNLFERKDMSTLDGYYDGVGLFWLNDNSGYYTERGNFVSTAPKDDGNDDQDEIEDGKIYVDEAFIKEHEGEYQNAQALESMPKMIITDNGRMAVLIEGESPNDYFDGVIMDMEITEDSTSGMQTIATTFNNRDGEPKDVIISYDGTSFFVEIDGVEVLSDMQKI